MNRNERFQNDFLNKTTLTATYTDEDNQQHELSLVLEKNQIIYPQRREFIRRTFKLTVCVLAKVKTDFIEAKFDDEQ